MDRIAIILLSIVIATALVVGASYAAQWLQPLLLQIPSIWMIAATTMMVSAGGLMHWRRKRA